MCIYIYIYMTLYNHRYTYVLRVIYLYIYIHINHRCVINHDHGNPCKSVMNSIAEYVWRLASHLKVQGPLRASFDVTQMQPPNVAVCC